MISSQTDIEAIKEAIRHLSPAAREEIQTGLSICRCHPGRGSRSRRSPTAGGAS